MLGSFYLFPGAGDIFVFWCCKLCPAARKARNFFFYYKWKPRFPGNNRIAVVWDFMEIPQNGWVHEKKSRELATSPQTSLKCLKFLQKNILNPGSWALPAWYNATEESQEKGLFGLKTPGFSCQWQRRVLGSAGFWLFLGFPGSPLVTHTSEEERAGECISTAAWDSLRSDAMLTGLSQRAGG